ncbi:hypothetical protein KVT40_001882 [Elsinoe batatas]|uniref:Secreted protein n=1 Tax=Elsinoe batatas TaxID=2601811 RepID=A0A8K0LDL2_9PEZI|nr:hypothetical protein KVT40_001882 [Elsinoe batatas]
MKAFTLATATVGWCATFAVATPRDAPVCPANTRTHRDGWTQQGIHLWNSLPEAVTVEVYENQPRRGVNYPGRLIGSTNVPAAPNARAGGTVDYWFPTHVATSAALLFVFRQVHEHCG